MKAMVLEKHAAVETQPLSLVTQSAPEPGPGQVRVRVLCCGVCHTDLHIVIGELVPPKLPVIPGHQVVGIVDAVGAGCTMVRQGDRVGMAWLHRTCGECRFCRQGLENLCERGLFTGYDVPGGFAEYTLASEDFVFPIPDAFENHEAAPLLCAGIIGYRCLRLCGASKGDRLGLYGFGAAAHIAIQVALHRGMEVFVFTRSEEHRKMARRLGAAWVGGAEDDPPGPCKGSIIFAPAGGLVPRALEQLDKGGTVALGGIYMTTIPEMDYTRHLYDEKTVRSVTASTRQDGHELLRVAAEVPIKITTQPFPLAQANHALNLLAASRINGEAVLEVSK